MVVFPSNKPGGSMKVFTIFSILYLLLIGTAFGAGDTVEGPKACQQCSMDRAVHARSRMLIVYADGTTVGVCSIHCAAEDMKQHGDKQAKSLMVGDFTTKELIDAKTATWVIGGGMPGVMTSQAKWAFASESEAQSFVKENGGQVASFDQAIKAAQEEVSGEGKTSDKHRGHMGPGVQMIFNPAFGDDIYHTHPAGMWMTSYKYMHTNMSGLQDGTTSVPVNEVIPMTGTRYGYMMAPTRMTMDMHMLMVMYGLTDRLTLMGMATYQMNTMDMLMNMGMGNRAEPPMRTNGFGDTELRGIYQINKYLVGSLGLSIPTGSINEEFDSRLWG
jgi:nitrous oxide reductase accessory protein NosL